MSNTTEEKVVNTKHFKSLANRVLSFCSNKFAEKSEATPFTVTIGSWNTITEIVLGCGYKSEIPKTGILATDYIDVYFDDNSLAAATAAGIIVETNADKITFYAKSIPTTVVEGVYFLRKGGNA